MESSGRDSPEGGITMCCRFYTDDTTKKDILGLADGYDRKINWLREGDVHPGDPAIVITGENGKLYAKELKWGFSGNRINARSETVQNKITFADSFKERRCVIPAKHFYEWDREKNKVQFSAEGEGPVYLAGIYSKENFVVLTADAGESMRPVHDRQPLVLKREELPDWMGDREKAAVLLGKAPEEFSVYREYEQLSLYEYF